MNTIAVKTDYLITGSGAMGMAFADTLLEETDATITIVDRYHKPGGHWNVAYPFVTLHQPSAFYGVSSRELDTGHIDQVGWNKGLSHLASGAQVSSYFDQVMQERFLPSGRVQYFPMCNYLGEHQFESITSGQRYSVEVSRKEVNCTYLNTSVPATHTPSFSIAPGVNFMPLNHLPLIKKQPAQYVIVGGGKTGIDACLWLLEHHVDPAKITWIVSRDAWLLDRRNTQPTMEFFEYSLGAQAALMESIAQAESIENLFDRLESSGVLLRIDPNIRPSMFHGATISQMELEQLRRIQHIVRLGRVTHIGLDEVKLDRGTLAVDTNTLFVDCSASAITNLAMIPVFAGDRITPQTVRPYQPVFSAAFIAHIEATVDDEAQKNKLCGVVPLPNHDTDWLRMQAAMMINQMNWSGQPGLRDWLINNRLDGFSRLVSQVSPEDTEKRAILKRMRDSAMPAMFKLQQLISQLDTVA